MFQILRGSDEFNVVWSYTADKDRNVSFISAHGSVWTDTA